MNNQTNQDAIDIVRQMVADGQISQEIAAMYVPELKESKDKRIIRHLIGFIKESGMLIIAGYKKSTVLAWLEKQGELVEYYEDKLDRCACYNFNKGYKKALEKQGEQKPVVDDKDAEKASEEYRNFRMSCGIKDPVMLNEIEEAYYEGAIRKQKPAWSEEDEEELKIALNTLEEAGQYSSAKWLKNVCLVPQYTWKPSDEQIKVLEFFIPYVTQCNVVLQKSKDTLLSLLSDLKKLREEYL